MDGGGKGKLEVLLGLGLGDSRESGGGEIGNCIGETGANCWHRCSIRRRRSILEWKFDDGGGADSVEDDGGGGGGCGTTCGRENFRLDAGAFLILAAAAADAEAASERLFSCSRFCFLLLAMLAPPAAAYIARFLPTPLSQNPFCFPL